ncbi:MAG: NifU family protein [Actinomycetota bacterium]|nr:NifU family protein [Actinomycetota bacterium]
MDANGQGVLEGEEVLRVTEPARQMVLDIRSSEENSGDLALWLEVSGAASGAFTYDMWFQPAGDAGPGDAVQTSGELTFVLAASSVDKLQGATLDVGASGGEQGLVMLNPNSPAPERPSIADRLPVDLSTPEAQRILEILEQEVNPQISMHGGWAELVAFDDGTAYVRMSGGCQGCGLAKVTLSQGIAVAIQDAVPAVREVVDVTDHASGTNPYYEPSKK